MVDQLNPLLWDAYLAIEHKAETDGKGNDDTSIEQLTPLIDHFKQVCPVEQYKHVWIPGCGAGTSVRMLKDAGYKPIGYTFGKDNIQMGQEKYGVVLLEHDMHTPGFNDESFDAILADNVLEHAISLHIMLLECWRILRVGGRFYITVPDPSDEKMWMIQWHHCLLYADQWLKYLKGYGFKLIESLNNGYTLVMEKVPAARHPTINYFQHTYAAMMKATN